MLPSLVVIISVFLKNRVVSYSGQSFMCIHKFVYVYLNFVKDQEAIVVCWKISSRIK